MSLDEFLLDAVESQSLEKVEQALAEGANPQAKRRSKSALDLVPPRRDDLRCLLIEAGAWEPDLLGRLVWAVGTGRPATVAALLQRGANPNAKTLGGSALLAAASQGSTEIARLLLEAGADVEVGNSQHTPLQAALQRGHSPTALLLLEYGARPQGLALAAARGLPEAAQALLAKGAAVNEVVPQQAGIEMLDFTALHAACQAGHLPIVEQLLAAGADPHLRDGSGQDALELASAEVRSWLEARGLQSRRSPEQQLWLALEAGDPALFEQVLNQCPQPDLDARDPRRQSRGLTALALASRFGHGWAVEALLSRGADPERADSDEPRPGLKRFVDFAGESALRGEPVGRTALFWAVLGNHPQVIHRLLQAGAQPQRVDFLGYHPLFLAARHGHQEALEALLACGLPVDLPGPSKSTALLEALRHGHRACAQRLLQAGASARVSSQGSTPLMEAAELADADLIRQLLAAGGRLTSGKKSSPPLARSAGATHQVPIEQAPAGKWPLTFNAHGGFAQVPRPESQVLEAVEALLEAGARVDEAGWLGPPLMAAARNGLTRVVSRLLQAGADPNQSHREDTALSVARLFEQAAVVAILEPLTREPHAQEPAAETPPELQAELALPDFSRHQKNPEFLAALNELEQLCGSPASPLAERPGAFELHVHSQRRAEFSTLEHQRRMLSRGFYLFEPHYSRQVESLMLIPSPRWQDALALMQTNGINSGQTPPRVLAWMERLEQEHPFELQTISHDTLAGTFRRPIANPRRLAQQMFEFCSDIVEQGCGSLAALTRELKKQPARLFFWWD